MQDEHLPKLDTVQLKQKVISGEQRGVCPIKLPINDRGLSESEEARVGENLYNLVGISNEHLFNEVLGRGVSAMPQSSEAGHNVNAVLQSLYEMNPKDSLESRLLAKETALYAQGMNHLARSESMLQKIDEMGAMHWHEAHLKYALRLLNLHNQTVDTIVRYRQRGEQKITVQHVNVNSGGQAVIAGNMEKAGDGGRGNSEI